MKSSHLFLIIFLLLFACRTEEPTHDPKRHWEQVKASVKPRMAGAFADAYEAPFRQELAAFGWEDGLHISRDGLHLYALYYPGDLFGWTKFFLSNLEELGPCELFGNTDYLRAYAETYGMDMKSNPFGCDDFINVDILYANRASTNSSFSEWRLSNIARPAAVEGSPFPLFNADDPSLVDIFLFTGDSEIWMIRQTGANPSGIENAMRLPTPINPVTNEFNADNPHLERLQDGRLLLVFEKYTNPDLREFYYSHSEDDGESWEDPTPISTVSTEMGKIEHPHLYQDPEGQWWMYLSINCDIYRLKQMEPGDWDSWAEPQKVIEKGSAACVGEPTLSDAGDISFVVVYENRSNGKDNDTYDIDPWMVKRIR